MQVQLGDGKGPHFQDQVQLVLLLGREACVEQHFFDRTLMEQDGCLPYRHMPEIADTTTAQAYHTEEERAHPDEAQRPPCSTHAPYAILVRTLVEQRNGTASGKAGFVAVKMLDVILTQLPAVVIAIARIKVGKP